MRNAISTLTLMAILSLAMRSSAEAQSSRSQPVDGAGSEIAEQKPYSQDADEPATIRYKGVRLTPGGFIEGAFLFRTRNTNADINNTYTGVPLNGTTNSKLTESRGSARDSRLSLLIESNAGATQLSGYFEIDFLGAAPTANYVQASSFTPRLRQAWLQLRKPSGWAIAGGQLWTLMTTHRHGIDLRSEFIPSTADGSYAVGYNWTRGRAFRVTKGLGERVWFGAELAEAENTYSAAFVPPNVMGLNTSENTSTGVLLLPYLPNYSNGNSTPIAPDLAAKVAVEPGWGHFEIKAIGRFFRDRIASTATTAGHSNTTYGYGGGFAAIMPVLPNKVDVILEGLAGQGIGRYGSAALPDVTLDPSDGRMLPLRTAHVFGGIEAHPARKLDIYGYLGNEYVGRYSATAPNGAPGGYGSPFISYSNCTNEEAMNTCTGANRNIQEVTAGYWYRLFKGSFGTVQYGNQVAFLRRTLWSGLGTAPQGSDLVVYSTVRFYLP